MDIKEIFKSRNTEFENFFVAIENRGGEAKIREGYFLKKDNRVEKMDIDIHRVSEIISKSLSFLERQMFSLFLRSEAGKKAVNNSMNKFTENTKEGETYLLTFSGVLVGLNLSEFPKNSKLKPLKTFSEKEIKEAIMRLMP